MIQRRNSTPGTLGRLATALLALLLAWPATSVATPSCEAHAQGSIPAERLANWEPVDDHALLVWTLHDSRAHLVELDHPLPGLLGAPTVFLVSHDHRRDISACGHDEVLVPGSGAARIIAIRYLSEKRTAELDRNRDGPSQARTTSI